MDFNDVAAQGGRVEEIRLDTGTGEASRRIIAGIAGEFPVVPAHLLGAHTGGQQWIPCSWYVASRAAALHSTCIHAFCVELNAARFALSLERDFGHCVERMALWMPITSIACAFASSLPIC